ncbi:aspartyl/asparaginyl beta-hydroxylase domain-containing protein [bacterium]|nr:MAG: aspartyl/asparaginyl beta-hydroxylase domain-containing protein [bacterium]
MTTQSSSLPYSMRLPFQFDVSRLHADLACVGDDEWVTHYETRDFEGGWSGVALQALGGQTGNLRALPMALPLYQPTPLLARCPYFAEVLNSFPLAVGAARLLRLDSGSRILPHQDQGLGMAEVRIHIPVQTNENVEFFLEGERIVLKDGECWFLDLSRMHSVFNGSDIPRVHLVLDCASSDWLWEQLSASSA